MTDKDVGKFSLYAQSVILTRTSSRYDNQSQYLACAVPLAGDRRVRWLNAYNKTLKGLIEFINMLTEAGYDVKDMRVSYDGRRRWWCQWLLWFLQATERI
jgi:hypothetical protein